MKTLRDFIEESVEFRGSRSPIVILDTAQGLKPNSEEHTLLNSTFNGLRVLAVQKTRKLFIGDQFKETHESIAKRFPSLLKDV